MSLCGFGQSSSTTHPDGNGDKCDSSVCEGAKGVPLAKTRVSSFAKLAPD
ncbi:MAG TPA: hypothetical protein V6C71_17930 [Coleofasciculaceae cyanobacterium]|jgi:hypothetical protein